VLWKDDITIKKVKAIEAERKSIYKREFRKCCYAWTGGHHSARGTYEKLKERGL
jgi:hypothetical protein